MIMFLPIPIHWLFTVAADKAEFMALTVPADWRLLAVVKVVL